MGFYEFLTQHIRSLPYDLKILNHTEVQEGFRCEIPSLLIFNKPFNVFNCLKHMKQSCLITQFLSHR